jgi:hypothetical protein
MDRKEFENLINNDPQYKHAIDSVRENVKNVFKQQQVPTSQLPEKDKIKLMGMYDYIAHTKDIAMSSA